jgi:8-oxo-dGTP diphosphatase
LWEFPGGKIEAGETGEQALIRELQEEVNVTPTSFEHFIDIDHNYGDRHVFVAVYLVHSFSGEAKGLEKQAIKWVSYAQLSDYQFPAANQKILTALAVQKIFSL